MACEHWGCGDRRAPGGWVSWLELKDQQKEEEGILFCQIQVHTRPRLGSVRDVAGEEPAARVS